MIEIQNVCHKGLDGTWAYPGGLKHLQNFMITYNTLLSAPKPACVHWTHQHSPRPNQEKILYETLVIERLPGESTIPVPSSPPWMSAHSWWMCSHHQPAKDHCQSFRLPHRQLPPALYRRKVVDKCLVNIINTSLHKQRSCIWHHCWHTHTQPCWRQMMEGVCGKACFKVLA